MISQAMLMISMTVIAPAPCRGAGFGMSHLAQSSNLAHQYQEQILRRTKSQGQTQCHNIVQTSDDLKGYKDLNEEDDIEEHQEVLFRDPDSGKLMEGIIHEVSECDDSCYVVYTHNGFDKISRKHIEKIRSVVGTVHAVQFCEKEDCKNKLRMKRRVDLQIEGMKSAKTSRACLCAAYELAANAMKRNVNIFKQSEWRFKWCCFVSSCLGCLGTSVFCCPTYCFEGGDGMADTLCKLFCCCAATSDITEAGEAATCGFCDYICCTGGSDGGVATTTVSTGGDVDCNCDCSGGDCLVQ